MFEVFCQDGICRLRAIAASIDQVKITASVGNGGINIPDDVRTIQTALNRIPTLQGGPLVPLKVDGLSGPNTISAIRRFQRERCGFPFPDGRVDRDQRTITRLREATLEAQGLLELIDQTVMAAVYERLQEVRRWTHSARRSLHQAALFLSGFTFAVNPEHLALVNKYFHLDKVPEAERLKEIAHIDHIFQQMQVCILRTSPMTSLGTGYFQVAPLKAQRDNPDGRMFTFNGGFQLSGAPRKLAYGAREDSINICTRKLIHDLAFPGFVTRVLVHELAHFVGPGHGPDKIDDHAYIHRDRKAFFKMSPFKARRSADSYSMFAGEANMRREPPLAR